MWKDGGCAPARTSSRSPSGSTGGWTADELRTLPGAKDDPRAEAVDGRILLLTDGETLGEVGSVQLLSPRGTVTIVATGTLLSASPDTAIAVDAVIDVAADVEALRP